MPARPKFLLDLTGSGRTLIQATVDRLTPLVGQRVVVVTGAAHEQAVRRQLPEVDRVIAEPSPRDSMAAIGLAAALLEREDPDALMGSFAADHVIDRRGRLRRIVREAAAVADDGLLVTIGIEPTACRDRFRLRPQRGAALAGHATARAVTEFVEKPDAGPGGGLPGVGGVPLERRHVRGPGGGAARPARREPPGARSRAARDRGRAASMAERWPGLTKIAIDYAVAEPAAAAGRVAMVPGPFGWEDLGDFASLGGAAAYDGPGAVQGPRRRVARGRQSDPAGWWCRQAGRTVAVVGLEDVVVVDTGDALLVTSYAQAQEVKAVARCSSSGGAPT